METDVKGTRVLVVDDSAITQRMVASALTEAGCEVVGFAANGSEAVEAYGEKRPDVVTLDLVMPQMDGFQALSLIKGQYPEAVVIIISSVSMKSRIIECLKSGADHYILKPFTKEKVQQVLSETLAKVRAR